MGSRARFSRVAPGRAALHLRGLDRLPHRGGRGRRDRGLVLRRRPGAVRPAALDRDRGGNRGAAVLELESQRRAGGGNDVRRGHARPRAAGPRAGGSWGYRTSRRRAVRHARVHPRRRMGRRGSAFAAARDRGRRRRRDLRGRPAAPPRRCLRRRRRGHEHMGRLRVAAGPVHLPGRRRRRQGRFRVRVRLGEPSHPEIQFRRRLPRRLGQRGKRAGTVHPAGRDRGRTGLPARRLRQRNRLGHAAHYRRSSGRALAERVRARRRLRRRIEPVRRRVPGDGSDEVLARGRTA